MAAMGRPGFAPDKGPRRQHERCQSPRQSLAGDWLPPTHPESRRGQQLEGRGSHPRASPSASRRLGASAVVWAARPAGRAARAGHRPTSHSGPEITCDRKGQSIIRPARGHAPPAPSPANAKGLVKEAVILFDLSALRPELRAAAGVISYRSCNGIDPQVPARA